MQRQIATEESALNRFTTTHWGLVSSSIDESGDAAVSDAALAELCKIYWRPIFAFICRRGHQVSDAQDLTQDFFVMILRGDLLQRARPARGRLRCLLLKALENFLLDEHLKRTSKKRGGGLEFIAWDDWLAEAPSHLALPARAFDQWPAERIFDVRWAATVVERALFRLREEFASRKRRRVFDVLSGTLSPERTEVSCTRLGKRLGVSSEVIKRLIFELRGRYRALLRQEIRKTVGKEEEVDQELRYLCAALAADDT